MIEIVVLLILWRFVGDLAQRRRRSRDWAWAAIGGWLGGQALGLAVGAAAGAESGALYGVALGGAVTGAIAGIAVVWRLPPPPPPLDLEMFD